MLLLLSVVVVAQLGATLAQSCKVLFCTLKRGRREFVTSKQQQAVKCNSGQRPTPTVSHTMADTTTEIMNCSNRREQSATRHVQSVTQLKVECPSSEPTQAGPYTKHRFAALQTLLYNPPTALVQSTNRPGSNYPPTATSATVTAVRDLTAVSLDQDLPQQQGSLCHSHPLCVARPPLTYIIHLQVTRCSVCVRQAAATHSGTDQAQRREQVCIGAVAASAQVAPLCKLVLPHTRISGIRHASTAQEDESPLN